MEGKIGGKRRAVTHKSKKDPYIFTRTGNFQLFKNSKNPNSKAKKKQLNILKNNKIKKLCMNIQTAKSKKVKTVNQSKSTHSKRMDMNITKFKNKKYKIEVPSRKIPKINVKSQKM